VHGGHGHHQAAGLLTPKSRANWPPIQLASCKERHPKQQNLGPWGDRKPVAWVLELDRGEKPQGYFSCRWMRFSRRLFTRKVLERNRPRWVLQIIGTQGITGFSWASPFPTAPESRSKREDGGELGPPLYWRKPLGALDEDYEVGEYGGVDPLMRRGRHGRRDGA